MDIFSVIGWIVLGLVALFGVGLLLTRSHDGGVRWMMHVAGWAMLLTSGVVAFLPFSNLFVLLALPLSLLLPTALMSGRAAVCMPNLRKLEAESQRTGVPVANLVQEDLRRRGFVPAEPEDEEPGGAA
ncbi:MAG: hypothetical protein H0W86_03750 [Armatimonadetes bacterium]|nr:hypothetical protein [Armatimonadota bacterium]